MNVLTKIPKGAGLPLTFGGIGIGYLLATALSRPDESDTIARIEWERHLRDAKIAAVFGVTAGAVLWFARAPKEQPRHSLF